MNDYITDYLAHQDHVQDYLCHYGVKGMKWGVRHDPERLGRRRSKKSTSSSGRRKPSSEDKLALWISTKEKPKAKL